MNQPPTKLERLLSQVSPVPPAEQLRERVLNRVAAADNRAIWPFVEGLAACLLVGMNLALAVGLTSPGSCRTAQAADPQAAMHQLRELSIEPELAGIARFGLLEDRTYVAPSLDLRQYRPSNGEL